MTRSKLLGALLLVVGLLAGGLVVDYVRAQSWPNFFDEDLFLDPDRYVVIRDGTPYTVPAGWVLLVQGLSSHYGNQASVLINGQTVIGCVTYAGEPQEFVPGFVAREGDTLSISLVSGQDFFLLGKLYRPLK